MSNDPGIARADMRECPAGPLSPRQPEEKIGRNRTQSALDFQHPVRGGAGPARRARPPQRRRPGPPRPPGRGGARGLLQGALRPGAGVSGVCTRKNVSTLHTELALNVVFKFKFAVLEFKFEI